MAISIVISIHIETDSPATAYAMLLDQMATITAPDTDFDWESSDEWYDSDGDPIPLGEQEKARSAGFRAWEFERTGIDPGVPPEAPQLPQARQPKLQG